MFAFSHAGQLKQPRFRQPWLACLAAIAIALGVATQGARAEPDTWKREGWSRTDFSKTAIDFSEVLSGGPPKDGIPSIDKPRFKPVAQTTGLAERSPVISIAIGGDARAYPLEILIWHEIVNDVVANRPLAVTYCPLCNAAIVFDRQVDGRTLEFGTTGKLRHSDLIMYDRQTESWWQQFTGEAIVGALLGQALTLVPSRLESFGEFRKRHPDGRVLIPNTPGMRPYGKNPYVGYDTAKTPFLYRGILPDNIDPMARIVVIGKRASPTAVSYALIRAKGTIEAGNITLRWRAGQASALDTEQIAKGRDVGTIIATKPGDDGKPRDVPYDVTFAFVFHAFHPKLRIRTE